MSEEESQGSGEHLTRGSSSSDREAAGRHGLRLGARLLHHGYSSWVKKIAYI